MEAQHVDTCVPSAHHQFISSYTKTSGSSTYKVLLRLQSTAFTRYLWLEGKRVICGGISVSPEVLTRKVPAKVVVDTAA